jgi:hypothetical protein
MCGTGKLAGSDTGLDGQARGRRDALTLLESVRSLPALPNVLAAQHLP